MVWKVELDPFAEKELDKLDPVQARRILHFLFDRIESLDNPRSVGEPLKGSRFQTLWKYRVGDYRLICSLEDKISRVLVVKIGNRREVYR
jgi:mRNA interferase RelE/StbE